MAMRCLRVRRALAVFSSSSQRFVIQPTTVARPLSHCPAVIRFCSQLQNATSACCSVQVRCFSEGRSWKLYKEGDEITEDTVLFEGCDFNHWLITVDFPKDPKPTPEEMVATYEKICAQGLNISVEEAKKKIYACSTTTYQGFQAIMTEAESEKFKDVPGVVFVLPDSYIDPVNKEYGGDKYENGVIFPRPPPYIAQREQRRDRNQRFDRPRNYQNQNQNPQYNQPRPMQGDGRNPQYNYPQYSQNQNPQFNHNQNPQFNQNQNPQFNQNQNPQFNQNQNPRYNQNQNPQYNQNQSPQHNQSNNFNPSNYSQHDPVRRDHGPPHNFTPHPQYSPQGQAPQMQMNDRDISGRGWNQSQMSEASKVPFQSNYNQAPLPNFCPQNQSGFPQGTNSSYGSPEQGHSDNKNLNSYPPGVDRNNSSFSSPSDFDRQSNRDGYGQNHQNERQQQPGPPQNWQNGNYRGGR